MDSITRLDTQNRKRKEDECSIELDSLHFQILFLHAKSKKLVLTDDGEESVLGLRRHSH
jgi:hypothetical protein